MDDDLRKIAEMGFSFANDLAKQLITLSTGILALTITFTKEILQNHPKSPLWLLKVAWAIHLVAILFGIMTMMALTGTLMPMNAASPEIRLTFDSNVRTPAKIQILSFLLGTLLIIIYGSLSFRKKGKGHEEFDNDIGKD